MEFYIGQNSNLPILKMQVIKDGKHDIDSMLQLLEESVLYFSIIILTSFLPQRIIYEQLGQAKLFNKNSKGEIEELSP